MILQILILGILLSTCITFILILIAVTIVLVILLHMALRVQFMN